MARPKGKDKKIPLTSSKDEPGSGGEDSVPSQQRKRGRPRKIVEDEVEEEELKEVVSGKAQKASKDVGKKRKRQNKLADSVENGAEKKAEVGRSGVEDPLKSAAAKPNGNRRKGKPRRAAEASYTDGK